MFMASIEAPDLWLQDFCERHRLPDSYTTMALRYLLPEADKLAAKATTTRPLLVGINGCQGSGKSTLAALLTEYLTAHHQQVVANLSIDDFYLTKVQRLTLAADRHPLFVTRGVPGTHDVTLLQQTLDKLRKPSGTVAIPRFDKAVDDRHPESQWDKLDTPVDVILLEGWCVGVTPQGDADLINPVNVLEAGEDSDGLWRQWVNQCIETNYQPLFRQIDHLLLLAAPSFDCVYQWRQKQEAKLRDQRQHQQSTATSGIMDDQALSRFIQHYQRLTEHMLRVLPQRANTVFTLNALHQITGSKFPQGD